MKTIYKLAGRLLPITFLITLSGCEKFLDQELHQAIASDKAIENIEDAQVALTGCYNGLQSVQLYARDLLVIADLAADNSKMNTSNAGRFVNLYQWDVSVNNPFLEGIWEQSYQTIFLTNKLLADLKNLSDGTTQERQSIEGQAKLIRSLLHFNLVNFFAQDYNYPATEGFIHYGVPVVTEQMSVDANPGRNLVPEVYRQILADLEGTTSEAGALTLLAHDGLPFYLGVSAARALASRVYLYMNGAANLEKARDYALEVINSGTYSLVPKNRYVDAWRLLREEENEELIFTLRFTNVDNWSIDMLGEMYMEQGYGDILATRDLVSLYADNDERMKWFREDGGFYYIEKFPGKRTGEEVNENTIKVSVNNHPLFRLAEMYLNAAEAEQLLGHTGPAQTYLNAVVTRAGGQAVELTDTELLQAIKSERRKELCFEGHRLWDIKRWHENIQRTDRTSPSVKSVVEYPSYLLAYPIPASEIETNSTIRNQQNPGY